MSGGLQVTSCRFPCLHLSDDGEVIYRHPSRWWVVSAGRSTLLDASTCVIKWLTRPAPGARGGALWDSPITRLVTAHPDWDAAPYPWLG